MGITIITGATGLIGAEFVLFFHNKCANIVGMDNDMRAYFFGDEWSIQITGAVWELQAL